LRVNVPNGPHAVALLHAVSPGEPDLLDIPEPGRSFRHQGLG
jgi:hypothetical protein